MTLAEKYPINQIPQDTPKGMGIEAGFGSSKFGIVVTQLVDDKINDMIKTILRMFKKYSSSKIYIDAANPEVNRFNQSRFGQEN